MYFEDTSFGGQERARIFISSDAKSVEDRLATGKRAAQFLSKEHFLDYIDIFLTPIQLDDAARDELSADTSSAWIKHARRVNSIPFMDHPWKAVIRPDQFKDRESWIYSFPDLEKINSATVSRFKIDTTKSDCRPSGNPSKG